MKIAVISDIHWNLPALEKVMEAIYKNKIKSIFCLGDISGYGPYADEVIKLILNNTIKKELEISNIEEIEQDLPKFISVMGNHDAAITEKLPEYKYIFNENSVLVIDKLRQRLSKESYVYLKSLKDKKKIDKILLVHGSPSDFMRYMSFSYIIREEGKFVMDNFPDVKIVFYGHTHIPALYSFNKKDNTVVDIYSMLRKKSKKYFVIDYNENNIYFINPGSIGQPRDRDQRASFLIFDDEKKSILFQRSEYNIKAIPEKIKSLDFHYPYIFYTRLIAGI